MSIDAAHRADAGPVPTLTWAGNRFFRDGAPHQVLAGSLHYFRVHPDQWRDRLQRLIDLGLNTVDTYVAWNFHQATKDAAADFTGWRDLRRFLEIAAEVGLDAIVRPGPYICAEWANGGLPVWITRGGAPLRTIRGDFLARVADWFDVLLPQFVDLQAGRGGNVVAVQVENEFGSYGNDGDYVAAMAELLRERGITELLFTADGPTDPMLTEGTTPGVLAAVTLGSKPAEARALVRTHRPDEPFFVAEFWNGWFDHWGTNHHVRTPENAAANLAEIISDGGSVSIYMAHGGTNFGLWAGANRVDGRIRSTITSYDSDAPIAEDGTLTAKFHAMREVLGATAPIVSGPPTFLPEATIPVRAGADLPTLLRTFAGDPLEVAATSAFEDLPGVPAAVVYRADVRLPAGDVDLIFTRVADRATVFSDDVAVGSVLEEGSITLHGTGEMVALTVLVEDLGQVNYGHTTGGAKGMVGPVLLERRIVQRWTAQEFDPRRLAPDALAGTADRATPDGAGVAVGVFEADEPRDTHLALPGFGRGWVYVNDFLVGRYSAEGPQRTLYVPAPLVARGRNVVVAVDLEGRGTTMELRAAAELGPEEEFIEEF